MAQISIDELAKAQTYIETWLPGVSPKYIELSAGQAVRYIEVGEGPTLVLLHTVRTQLDIFQKIIPKLRRMFRVYALDYPGFGWSRIVANTSYTEPFLRRSVIEFIEKLGLQDVTLAGESIGATLSLTISTILGDRIRAVVALNPYDYFPGLERANFAASAIIKTIRAPLIGPPFAAMENKMVLTAVMRGGVVDPAALPDAYLTELSRSGKRRGYSGVARSTYKSLQSFVEARKLYPYVKAPLTLVYGENDWSTVEERRADAELLNNAKFTTVPKAGHFISLEKPDMVAEFIFKTRLQNPSP